MKIKQLIIDLSPPLAHVAGIQLAGSNLKSMQPGLLRGAGFGPWLAAAFALAQVAAFTPVPAAATLVNGGFETGTAQGWILSLAGDVWVDRRRPGAYESGVLYPYSSSTIPWLGHFSSVAQTNGPVSAQSGNSYLFQRGIYSSYPDAYSEWTQPDGWTYHLSAFNNALRLEQTVHLDGDQMAITGWAQYGTMCDLSLAGHDPVLVLVNGVAVWSHDTASVPLAPTPFDLRTTGWEPWSFLAPAAGDYTVALEVGPACQFGVWATLDGVQVVPEPGSLALLLLGAATVLRVTRRQR